jgi:hypothetical protein
MRFIRALKISGAEESPTCRDTLNRQSAVDRPATHGRRRTLTVVTTIRYAWEKRPLSRARVLPELSVCKIMPRGQKPARKRCVRKFGQEN